MNTDDEVYFDTLLDYKPAFDLKSAVQCTRSLARLQGS